MNRRLVWITSAAVPLAVLTVFFLYPVGRMLWLGFAPDGRFDPGAVLAVLGRRRTVSVLWFTLWTATVATAITVVLGVPLAHVLYRLRFRGRGLMRALVLIPFVLPTVVVGLAFGQLYGPNGWLAGLGWEGTPAAIVSALVFFNISVVVRTVGSSWESLDPRRAQAAAVLGATPAQVFRTVTLPALRPAIAGAASVVFLFCATAFGVVLTLGGSVYANVETEIYALTTVELDLPGAAALSITQIVVVTALLTSAARTRGQVPQDRRPVAPRRVGRRDFPWLVGAVGVGVLLALPVLTLVLRAFDSGSEWGLGNFRRLGSTSDRLPVSFLGALSNSVQIAIVASLLSVLLGGLVAVLVSRPVHGNRWRRAQGIFDGAFMLPLGVSAVTLGFGFLIALGRPPLNLRSSPWLVPIAQALVALPLVVRTVAPVLRAIDDRQRQAAATLGAGPWRVLRTVDLTVVRRPLAAAFGFAFAISLGEFGATSFVVRDQTPTLPIVIYQFISHPGIGNAGAAMAASLVLAALTGGIIVAIEAIDRSGTVGRL